MEGSVRVEGERNRIHNDQVGRIFLMSTARGYVYILASKPYGTLYVGVTNDIVRRMIEHREGRIAGFTRKYGVKRLVYLESYGTVPEAIAREKAVKEWRRAWKVKLIERDNPLWDDLSEAYFGLPRMPERARRASMPHCD